MIVFVLLGLVAVDFSNTSSVSDSVTNEFEDIDKTESILVVGDRPPAAIYEEDPSAAATEINLTNRYAGDESFIELFNEVPGATSLRTGGHGSFVGLSIRASGADHTQVLLGNLPISGADRGAVDLSLLPLSVFERLEVFRGSAPVWIGSGQIGGVLRLHPKTARESYVKAELSIGSFDSYQGRATLGLRAADKGITASGGFLLSEGNFTFEHNGGTFFDPSDDGLRKRENAQVAQYYGFIHADTEITIGTLSAVFLGVHRNQGVPTARAAPVSSNEDFRPKRNQLQIFSSLAYTVDKYFADRLTTLNLSIGGDFEQNALKDPIGNLGFSPIDSDDSFFGLQARAALKSELTSWLNWTTTASFRFDEYRPENQLAPVALPSSNRETSTIATELNFYHKYNNIYFELRPSISAILSQATTHDETLGQTISQTINADKVNYRLGAALSPIHWMTFKATAASGSKLPTVLQLFGNRYPIEANPFLNPETSDGFDLGLVINYESRLFAFQTDIHYYYQNVRNLIQLQKVSRETAMYINIESARNQGLEWIAQLRFKIFRLLGNMTYTDATNGNGTKRALVSPWDIFIRPHLLIDNISTPYLDTISIYFDVIYQSESYGNDSNLEKLPANNWIGLGTQLSNKNFKLTFDLRDLFNKRGFNIIGYPIPGRRFMASIQFKENIL